MKKGNAYALGKEKGRVQREIARFVVQNTLRPQERDKARNNIIMGERDQRETDSNE